MKIYAIWKYTDENKTAIESAYSKECVERGMDALKEQQLLQQRQTESKSDAYCNLKVSLKEFNSYSALSFHGQLTSISGSCILVGDEELQNLSLTQKFFLMKNILKNDRSLADIIRDPSKYISKYYFSISLSSDAIQTNQAYITHKYDLNSPSNLNNCQRAGTTFFTDQRYPGMEFEDEADYLDYQDALKQRAQELSDNWFVKIFRGCNLWPYP